MFTTPTTSNQIIAGYIHTYDLLKKYVIFGMGALIGIGIIGYYLWSYINIQTHHESYHIGFIQSGGTIQASRLYFNHSGFALGDFMGYGIGGSFGSREGRYISNNNFITYQDTVLPRYSTPMSSLNYLGSTNAERVSNYITNFVQIDSGSLHQYSIKPITYKLPQVNSIKEFKLECLNSRWKVLPDFCEYNIKQFAQQVYRIDMDFDKERIMSIVPSLVTHSGIHQNFCQSVLKQVMLTNTINPLRDTLLETCEPTYQDQYNTIRIWQSINKELDTVLTTGLVNNKQRDNYKLVSAMQILDSQIQGETIDIDFLSSYRLFVSEYLKSPSIDQRTIDIIYKFHNHYLIPGCIKLQEVVNVDTVRDLQNMIDRLDIFNNGDGLNILSLRSRVSPDIILPTDYAQTHPPLGEALPVISGSSSVGVDNSVINTLIGSIDSTITKGLSSSGTNTTNNQTNTIPSEHITEGNDNQKPSSIDTKPDTNTNSSNNIGIMTNTASNTTNTSISTSSNSGTTNELDLNTYKPGSSSSFPSIYAPGGSTNSTNEYDPKKTVSDRMLNNLGLTPTTIITKGEKYFVERTYKGFFFSALLNPNDDWKLSPIFVTLDGSRTLIPEFSLYLMDYDRYSQIKFLKDPDSYVRQATQ
ncbi:MAG TPA: hypothetical protein PLW93_01600 [Candidatus Absconditabacterales bacterium]|nr:hypothetical protein [Candidatus Absconditabacterales bacterium]HNG96948.1 hypothetical protein [Candidatus Absconditabacterales bacterium]